MLRPAPDRLLAQLSQPQYDAICLKPPIFTLQDESSPDKTTAICSKAVEHEEEYMVDRLALQQVAQKLVNPDDAELALDCIHVWDALAHLPRSQQFANYNLCKWNRIITSSNMSTSHKHVLEAGFFAPLSTIKRPITHIISKAINIRCQARKFPTVVLKNIKSSSIASKQLAHTLNEILTISLLGNYPHIKPEDRLSSWPRYMIRNALKSEKGILWLVSILKGCYFLLINALRELLVHSVRSDISLERHLHKLMHLDTFQKIVTEHMNKVRQYFQTMLPQRSSCLCISFEKPNGDEMKRVCHDLNQILFGSHVRILKASFRRPNQHEFQFPPTLQKKQPMVPLQNYDANEVIAMRDLEQFNKTRRQQMKLIQSQKQADSEIPSDIAKVDHKQHNQLEHKGLSNVAQASGEDELQCTSDDMEHIFQYITVHQYQALRQIVIRNRPIEGNIVFRVLPMLVYLGVEKRACDFAMQQMEYYRDNTTSVEQLKIQFGQLRKYYPHCYNLLQITCSIIRELQKHWLLYLLPLSVTQNQIYACATRLRITTALQTYNTQNNRPAQLLDSTLHFVICRVCNTIYSMLHEYGAVYKTTYRFCLRDVSLEYCSGKIYCIKSKANHRGRCADQPLEQISLLGRILVWNQRLIMLCPQPGCGNPMTVDNQLCDFSEYGPCCKPCTEKRIAHPKSYQELESRYNPQKAKDKMLCVQCQKRLERATESICIAIDISLCSVCARPHIVKMLQHRVQHSKEPVDKQQVLQWISNHSAQHYKSNQTWREDRFKKSHAATKMSRNRR